LEALLPAPDRSVAGDCVSPLDTLINTILSQNTNDRNRDRAYTELRSRYPDNGALARATEEQIAESIRAAGLHRQKARTIREALRRIREERGDLDLAFLRALPLEEALDWLTALRGVGKKTAGIVLLFCFDRPYFPVDTHIRRVCTRLGVLGRSEDPHDALNGILTPDAERMRRLHLGLIRLGRERCHPRTPRCRSCPLLPRCVHGAERMREEDGDE
jgi:endonuclease-3